MKINNSVENSKINWTISEKKNDQKKNFNLTNYWINYFTEFDLYTDIVIIVKMLCSNIS